MVSCKYKGGKIVSQHAINGLLRSNIQVAYDIFYDSTDGLYPKIHLADYCFYTGCLKIVSTKKTVASRSPKKSKKTIFHFFKQNG
jgi:hypothetical protein